MLGENELVKLFPDFKDLVQPSGIDLALDKIYTQESEGSLIDNEKNLPEIKELEGPVYTLKPHTAYLILLQLTGKSKFRRAIQCYICQDPHY